MFVDLFCFCCNVSWCMKVVIVQFVFLEKTIVETDLNLYFWFCIFCIYSTAINVSKFFDLINLSFYKLKNQVDLFRMTCTKAIAWGDFIFPIKYLIRETFLWIINFSFWFFREKMYNLNLTPFNCHFKSCKQFLHEKVHNNDKLFHIFSTLCTNKNDNKGNNIFMTVALLLLLLLLLSPSLLFYL